MTTSICRACSDDIPPQRAQLGYRTCLPCGEQAARDARSSWTVVQEYTKGNYQFITPSAVDITLRQTNPKENRA